MVAHLKIFLLVVVASAVVYANSLHNSFHFDDQHYIVENLYIKDISNIPLFFKSPRYSSFEGVFTSHYRPFLVTSYAVNYAIGGLNPAGFHIVNLGFHAGSAFLVYLILLTILRGSVKGEQDVFIALAAGLIFLLHPFNSEVVNYITARSSVMCSFFYLFSFYCWIRFREAAINSEKSAAKESYTLANLYHPPAIYYILSLFFFILAILTKEIAITLPAVLFLYDLYFRPRTSFNYKEYFPYVILVIIPYLFYRIMVYGRIIGGSLQDFYPNLLTQPTVLLKYIQLLVFPRGLTIEHDISMSYTINDMGVILSIISLIILLAAAYFLYKRGKEWRLLSFFILWFFITLLPTTLIPLNAKLQENRGYLAGIGFMLFTGVIAGKLRGRIQVILLVVVLFLYSILTIQQNSIWKDDYTLWKDAVKKNPASARVHDNMGLAYIARGEYDLAVSEFKETLRLNQLYYLAHYNAAVVYQLQNNLDKARESYKECLKINPGYFRAYYNLGIVYKKSGEIDKAIRVYEKAISLDPRHAFVYNNLGVALTEKGEFDKAEAVFKKAIVIDPRYFKVYYNLGNLYYRAGNFNLAKENYQTAISIKPDYKEARDMLSKLISGRDR